MAHNEKGSFLFLAWQTFTVKLGKLTCNIMVIILKYLEQILMLPRMSNYYDGHHKAVLKEENALLAECVWLLVESIRRGWLRGAEFPPLSPLSRESLCAALPLKSIYGLCFNPFLKPALKSVGAHAWKRGKQWRTGASWWCPAGLPIPRAHCLLIVLMPWRHLAPSRFSNGSNVSVPVIRPLKWPKAGTSF